MNASLTWNGTETVNLYLDQKITVFPGTNVRTMTGYSNPKVMANYISNSTSTFSFVLQSYDVPL